MTKKLFAGVLSGVLLMGSVYAHATMEENQTEFLSEEGRKSLNKVTEDYKAQYNATYEKTSERRMNAEVLRAEARRNGQEVPLEAIKLFAEAALEGDRVAYHRLGELFELAGNTNESLFWYKKSAIEDGKAESSALDLAKFYLKSGNVPEAVYFVMQAARSTDRDNQEELDALLKQHLPIQREYRISSPEGVRMSGVKVTLELLKNPSTEPASEETASVDQVPVDQVPVTPAQ